MLESIALAKAGSAVVEQQLKSLDGKTRDTKKRTSHQTHQRDWLRMHAELQKQRAEAEGARTVWLQSEAEAASSTKAYSDGLAQLGKLAQQDEQDAAIRREWSVEMRSQLQGLRELCETAVAEQKSAAAAAAAAGRGPTIISSQVSQQSAVAGQLLSDLSRSLASQSARLAGAADALERDLRAHAASILAPDEPEEVAVSDYVKHGCEDIAALAGDFITPIHERSDKEVKLLEALGAGLKAAEEAHREGLRGLREEFFGADDSEEGRRADDAADLAETPRGGHEGGGHEGGGHEGGGGSSPTLDVAGDYYVLEGGPQSAPPSEPPSPKVTCAPEPLGSGGGAWGEAEQRRLVKLEREFRGRVKAQLISRLKIELPGWGADVLEGKVEELHRQRAYANRRRAMLMSWRERKQALAKSARQLLQELAASEGRLRLRREEEEALASRRRELRQTLAVLERVKAEREAEAAAEAEALRLAAEAMAEAQRLKNEAERAHKKALIAAYQQEQQEHHRHVALIRLEEEAAKQAERLAQAEYNLKRVGYRMELEEKKRELRAEQREHERLVGEEQALRLQRVREAVLERMGDLSDPDRTVGPTAASSATALASQELFPVYGYADATLMKDMRFKLGHALRNAGLNGTEYARELLLSKRWGAPSRPDAVNTTFQLGYDGGDK